MADPSRPEPPEPVDVAPEGGPADLWRKGTPHAKKPRERHRIHPDGDTPDDEHDADEADDDDDDKNADRPKSKGKDDNNGEKAKGKPKGDNKGEDKDDGPEDKRPLYQKPVFWIAVVVLGVGIVVGVMYWLHARHFESTDDAYIEGHVVQISPQVSARVLKVYIDDNQKVSAGESLLDLDPIDYQVALRQAQGNEAAALGKLDQAKANVENSKSQRDEAKASLDAAVSTFEKSDQDLKRYEALDDRARSKQQYDQAIAQQKSDAAQVNSARAKLASAESQIAVAVANVAAAQGDYETGVANRRSAEVNLGYCHLTAPRDGRVTTKNVEPGMYASAGTPLFAIVEPEVWVVANYKETQLADMRIGQAVTISIDAYPDKDFSGKVQSIQAGTGARFSVLPAENATGNFVKVVQRVPVKIIFDEGQTKDPEHLLSPGLSVGPKVKVR